MQGASSRLSNPLILKSIQRLIVELARCVSTFYGVCTLYCLPLCSQLSSTRQISRSKTFNWFLAPCFATNRHFTRSQLVPPIIQSYPILSSPIQSANNRVPGTLQSNISPRRFPFQFQSLIRPQVPFRLISQSSSLKTTYFLFVPLART